MDRWLHRLALCLGLALALAVAGLGHAAPAPQSRTEQLHPAPAAERCCPDMAAADCRDMHGTHVCCLLSEALPLPRPPVQPRARWPLAASLQAVIVAPQPRPPDSSAA